MTMLLRITFLLMLFVAAHGAVDHLKEACGKTPHPKLCVSVLSAVPESKTADARGLAQIAIRAAPAKMSAAAARATDAEQEAAEEINRHEDNACTPAAKSGECFYYCGGGFKVAAWMLEAKNATDDAARFASACFYFQGDRVKAYGYRVWNCDRCHVVGRHSRLPKVISKGSDTERFMEVTSRLVAQAPDGTAPLPPPSEDVYEFLNWMDEQCVQYPDTCPASAPEPPRV